MKWINQTAIFTIVIILLVCSIGCQIIIGVFYQNMIRATDSMVTTDNKLLKQCKQKFIQCYRTNGGVANISVFVDKFLNKIKIMRLTIRGVKHLSGQLMLFSVLVAGFGICKGLIEGVQFRNLLPYYILSFVGLYVYFCMATIVDMQGSRQIVKINLIDYLENHVSVRLQTGLEEKSKLVSLDSEISQEKGDKLSKDQDNIGTKIAKHKKSFSEKDAEELEELLKAFLT